MDGRSLGESKIRSLEQPINIGDTEIPEGDFDLSTLIAQTNRTPEEEKYFMRMDTKTVVGSETEYISVQERGVPLQIISYSQAIQLLKKEKEKHNKRIKARRKQKSARKSRKRNRSS